MTTIYIADDEPVPIRLLKMTLERQGYEVESFHNGKAVLERIRQCQPDALITDIEMPVMTGEELCKHITDEFPERSCSIFVVNSVADLSHRDWARKVTNLSFVEKPLSMRRLSSELKVALGSGEEPHD
jgi:CheY-like chemotaxis protein